MNEVLVKDHWKQRSGKIKEKWDKHTDDDRETAEGNKDYLFGKLREHYGLARAKAKQHLKDFGHS